MHSSIKELLPPGRGSVGVAQQCPVGKSLFLPPAKRLAFRMAAPRWGADQSSATT